MNNQTFEVYMTKLSEVVQEFEANIGNLPPEYGDVKFVPNNDSDFRITCPITESKSPLDTIIIFLIAIRKKFGQDIQIMNSDGELNWEDYMKVKTVLFDTVDFKGEKKCIRFE
jgi:hypothetical protein